jgi:hypothetical protein
LHRLHERSPSQAGDSRRRANIGPISRRTVEGDAGLPSRPPATGPRQDQAAAGLAPQLFSSQSRLDKIVGDVLLDLEQRDRFISGRGNALLSLTDRRGLSLPASSSARSRRSPSLRAWRRCHRSTRRGRRDPHLPSECAVQPPCISMGSYGALGASAIRPRGTTVSVLGARCPACLHRAPPAALA